MVAQGDASVEAPILVEGLVTRIGEQLVHDHLDLEMRPGEILGLVGGSGSGKSVLLSTLIGLRPPSAGVVRIFGVDLYAAAPASIADLKSRWGVLFQTAALFSTLTVRENVEAPLLEHTRLSAAMIRDLADVKIALAGLPPEAGDLRPAELSGGMLKRAGLARAIAADPDLLLLDEPTSGLDPVVAAQFDRLIVELARNLRLSVLLITHDLDSLYVACDRVAALAEQRIIAVGPAAELAQSDHPWLKRYFNGPRGRAAATTASRALERASSRSHA